MEVHFQLPIAGLWFSVQDATGGKRLMLTPHDDYREGVSLSLERVVSFSCNGDTVGNRGKFAITCEIEPQQIEQWREMKRWIEKRYPKEEVWEYPSLG